MIALCVTFAAIPEIITSQMQYDFGTRTFNYTSTGSPVTRVEWFKGNSFAPPSTQELLLMDIVTATYHNLLTITSSNIEDYSGTFRCIAFNNRGFIDEQVLAIKCTKNVTCFNVFSYSMIQLLTSLGTDYIGLETPLTSHVPLQFQ